MTSSDAPKLFPAVLSIAILIVYLLLPTRNYYWDGVGFAQAIEDAHNFSPALFHPNHLVYTAAGYLEYRAAHALGFSGRALPLLRITNSVLSAGCAYLLFQILWTWLGSVYWSGVLTALLAFSAAWWKFSTDANAYIPSVFFLLLCFRWLLPDERAHPLRVAAAHAAAMLFHELAILFLPVALAGLAQQCSSLNNWANTSSRNSGLEKCIRYLAAVCVLTGGAYAAAFYWTVHSRAGSPPSGLFAWAVSHSSDASFSLNPARDLIYSARGHLQLFFGGRIGTVLRQGGSATIALAAICVTMLAVAVFLSLRRRRGRRGIARLAYDPVQYRDLLGLLALWILAYEVFLFFWLPWNMFYRLFYLPALILLAGALVARHPPAAPRGFRVALWVGALAVYNLTFFIRPNARIESNPPLAFALQMAQVWKPGDTVYFSVFNTDDWTARYFNPATAWLPIGASSPEALDPLLAALASSGKAAWLDTTALEALQSTERGRAWLSTHAIPNSRRELNSPGHRMVFERIGLGTIFPPTFTKTEHPIN